tara:strand:- start:346 stop:1332 length:987 start_codon:yes stop_codon:yes gene_type:complete
MAFDNIQLEIYVYSGISSGYSSSDKKYTLNKQIITGETKINFEISELVRDFINIEFNDDYASYAAWVRTDATIRDENNTEFSYGSPVSNTYLALDGYGYFEEGISPELSRNALITTNTLYIPENTAGKLPIFAEGVGKVTIDSSDTQITDNGNTNQKIQYVTIPANSSTIKVYDTDDTTLKKTININNVCEPKYTFYKVTFVNKFGAFQDLYFFKKTTERFEVTDETYKRNIFENANVTYDTHRGQRERYNTNARTSITLNTGFVNEDFNSAIEELFLSEKVFIRWQGQTLSVIPKSKSLKLNTSVNDKLSNYTVDFEFAFNKINNVR